MQVVDQRYINEVSREGGYNLRTVLQLVRGGQTVATLPVTGGTVEENVNDNIRSTFSAEVVDEEGIFPASPDDPLWPGGVYARVLSGPRYPDNTSKVLRKGTFRVTSIRGAGSGSISLEGKDLGYNLSTPMIQPYQIEAGIETTTVIAGIATKKDPRTGFHMTTTGYLTNAGVVDTDMIPLDEIVKLAAHASCEAFFNLDGLLQVSPYDQMLGEVVWEFTEGVNAFWNEEKEINTDGVPSAVIVEANHSGLAAPLLVVVTDNNPKSATYYSGDYGSVVDKITSEKISTREQAVKLGYEHLRAKRWLERFTFECPPISALSLNDTISVTRARLKMFHKRAAIESISYPLAPGPMTITATSRRVMDLSTLQVDG